MRRVLILISTAVLLISTSSRTLGARGGQTTTFKNIKVLNGLSDDEIENAMLYMRGSLGVQCEHCHTRTDWSEDDKKEKRTAREMIKMVQAINKEHFDGDLAVTCYTCHHGRVEPATALPLLVDRPARVTAAEVTPAPDVTVDAVLDRYLRESGGADAWSRLKTRTMTGTLVTSEPAEYPAEVFQQAPSRLATRIVVDKQPFLNVFDGERGWSKDNGGTHDKRGDDLERIRRRAAFAAPADMKRVYPGLSVEGRTTIGSEPAVVLIGTASAGPTDRLFFSERTGLLVRIQSATESVLGRLPRRFEYDDYRLVDGVRLPFRYREVDADYTYSWEFTSARHGVAVDDALFKR